MGWVPGRALMLDTCTMAEAMGGFLCVWSDCVGVARAVGTAAHHQRSKGNRTAGAWYVQGKAFGWGGAGLHPIHGRFSGHAARGGATRHRGHRDGGHRGGSGEDNRRERLNFNGGGQAVVLLRGGSVVLRSLCAPPRAGAHTHARARTPPPPHLSQAPANRRVGGGGRQGRDDGGDERLERWDEARQLRGRAAAWAMQQRRRHACVLPPTPHARTCRSLRPMCGGPRGTGE